MALLTDGYQCLVAFETIPNAGGVVFREREVKPPDLDGGGPLDTTTMRNVIYRTRRPKKLIGQGGMSCKVQWDPKIYEQPLVYINQNDQGHLMFADKSGIDFWGWINKLSPQAQKEGDFSEAELELFLSNQNNDSVEQSISYKAIQTYDFD